MWSARHGHFPLGVRGSGRGCGAARGDFGRSAVMRVPVKCLRRAFILSAECDLVCPPGLGFRSISLPTSKLARASAQWVSSFLSIRNGVHS